MKWKWWYLNWVCVWCEFSMLTSTLLSSKNVRTFSPILKFGVCQGQLEYGVDPYCDCVRMYVPLFFRLLHFPSYTCRKSPKKDELFALSFFHCLTLTTFPILLLEQSNLLFLASSLRSDAKKSHTSNPQYYLELCICEKKPNKPLSLVMFNSIYWFCKVHYGPSIKSQEKTPWFQGGIWGVFPSIFHLKSPSYPCKPILGSFQGIFPWTSLTVHCV